MYTHTHTHTQNTHTPRSLFSQLLRIDQQSCLKKVCEKTEKQREKTEKNNVKIVSTQFKSCIINITYCTVV